MDDQSELQLQHSAGELDGRRVVCPAHEDDNHHLLQQQQQRDTMMRHSIPLTAPAVRLRLLLLVMVTVNYLPPTDRHLYHQMRRNRQTQRTRGRRQHSRPTLYCPPALPALAQQYADHSVYYLEFHAMLSDVLTG